MKNTKKKNLLKGVIKTKRKQVKKNINLGLVGRAANWIFRLFDTENINIKRNPYMVPDVKEELEKLIKFIQ